MSNGSSGSPGGVGVSPNSIGRATSKSYDQTDRFHSDRFHSFAERYIIERASSFTKGKELEEGWQAAQDAKKLYQIIADVAQVEATNSGPTQQAHANGEAPTYADLYSGDWQHPTVSDHG